MYTKSRDKLIKEHISRQLSGYEELFNIPEGIKRDNERRYIINSGNEIMMNQKMYTMDDDDRDYFNGIHKYPPGTKLINHVDKVYLKYIYQRPKYTKVSFTKILANLDNIKDMQIDPNTEYHSINTQDDDGKTLLTHAVERNDTVTVKSLLEKGAKVNIIDNRGACPIYYALLNRNMDIMKLVYTNGILDALGDNPLKMAYMMKRYEAMPWLFEQGDDPQHENYLFGQSVYRQALSDDTNNIFKNVVPRRTFFD
jgi:ankyrin repeat protein